MGKERQKKPTVVIVESAPYERTSDEELFDIVSRLEVEGIRCEFWYLQALKTDDHNRGNREIDSLRRWFLPRMFDASGMKLIGSRLRGARLRLWFERARPDVIIFNDGYGQRILDSARVKPKTVVRYNNDSPRLLAPEKPFVGTPDLELKRNVLDGDKLFVLEESERARLRAELTMDNEMPLIIGIGDDGWIDGPDLFVRAMWAAEYYFGVSVQGRWLGLSADSNEIQRIEAEARRCAVDDRFEIVPYDYSHSLCGDVLFISHRSPHVESERRATECLLSGCSVVSFSKLDVESPFVIQPDPIDVHAAGQSRAAFSSHTHVERSNASMDSMAPVWVVSDIVSLANGNQPRVRRLGETP